MIKVRPGGGLGDHLLLKYEVPTNVESAEQITIGREELEELRLCKRQLVRIGTFLIFEVPEDPEDPSPSHETIDENAVRVIRRLQALIAQFRKGRGA